MRMAFDYFQTVQVLDFDEAAYQSYMQLQQQKIRIGTQDMRIAAITLSIRGKLVTRNARDFSRVPSLVFEDWTA